MHASEFTVPVIIIAGLLNGINPCVISTLVFFVSLLAVAGIRGRAALVVGAALCTGSYVTYLLLGLGLVHVIHAVGAFAVAQHAVELSMASALLICACVSFRDAYVYARSGAPARVALQLPGALKRSVHAAIRRGITARRVAAASLALGCMATLFESVCTGQVYVPALTAIVKTHHFNLGAWLLLLVYNACFVTPLACVFVLVYYGTSTRSLLVWSRANVVVSKCAMGCLFIMLLIMLLVL